MRLVMIKPCGQGRYHYNTVAVNFDADNWMCRVLRQRWKLSSVVGQGLVLYWAGVCGVENF